MFTHKCWKGPDMGGMGNVKHVLRHDLGHKIIIKKIIHILENNIKKKSIFQVHLSKGKNIFLNNNRLFAGFVTQANIFGCF